MTVVWILCLFGPIGIYAQETTNSSPPNATQTVPPPNTPDSHTTATTPIQNNSNDAPDETPVSDAVLPPEIVLDSASGVDIPDGDGPKIKTKFYYKPLPVELFQKFSVLHWWRPVQEKLDKLKEVLAITKHPNYGGVQFLSPQEIWERLHEKAGQHLLTGINGAVFGLASVENHDYPFAYRQSRRGSEDK